MSSENLRLKFRAWHKSGGVMSAPFDLMGVGNAHQKIDLNACIVMQYTGLTDKNGVDIYEGDYLQTSDGFGGVVEWVEKDAGFNKFIPMSKFEVVGNVYENPELLGGGSETA